MPSGGAIVGEKRADRRARHVPDLDLDRGPALGVAHQAGPSSRRAARRAGIPARSAPAARSRAPSAATRRSAADRRDARRRPRSRRKGTTPAVSPVLGGRDGRSRRVARRHAACSAPPIAASSRVLKGRRDQGHAEGQPVAPEAGRDGDRRQIEQVDRNWCSGRDCSLSRRVCLDLGDAVDRPGGRQQQQIDLRARPARVAARSAARR